MSNYENFVQSSKEQLDRLGEELNELEAKVKNAGQQADDWSRNQIAKLKSDWSLAKTKIDRVAQQHHEEVEASWAQVKTDVENHWTALQAAVATYRKHVENNSESAKA